MKGTRILDDCRAAIPALWDAFPFCSTGRIKVFNYCKFAFALTEAVNSTRTGLLAHESGCFLELLEVF